MAKERVLVARATFPDIIGRLEEHFEVERNVEDVPFDRARLHLGLADKVGAMLMGAEPIDTDAIAAAPRLRAVSNCAAGYNNFDLQALTKAGIVATNTPEVSNESVADMAWALLLSAARRVRDSDAFVRSGAWRGFAYDLYLGTEVNRATLGILGMGRIGQAIALRAAGFRMRVIYHNRRRLDPDLEAACGATWVERSELFRTADHLVLVLPYSADTHHAVGERELDWMKPGATLVNIARGGIVDDAALARALTEGRIAAAGLDVFEGEPRILPALLAAPNLVMTPHIGSATTDTRRALAHLAVDNLIAALGYGPDAGRPRNVLNPDALGSTRSRRAF
jgi:gluconate 2-dehydrogenase